MVPYKADKINGRKGSIKLSMSMCINLSPVCIYVYPTAQPVYVLDAALMQLFWDMVGRIKSSFNLDAERLSHLGTYLHTRRFRAAPPRPISSLGSARRGRVMSLRQRMDMV